MTEPTRPSSISQNPDIRLLGKMLGDVIRAYGGDKLYRQTEYIRSTSVDRFRGIEGADSNDRGLGALSLDDTLNFVRGFMLFSLLANLAEDRQGLAHEDGATFRTEDTDFVVSDNVDFHPTDVLEESHFAG